ncbi:TetR/AcrR family transcriptional regulator [Amycolatopsis echigonensis]|uniref:TetR family transcriptional regulator C-terminal domain-containing protein n=1 Tax=Amycolatopsis echigonensis TaxID=2576905 RepID=A0A8E1WA53_9PSEU|nr:TetR family transcriptional regulator C-terminal domain-containing protein [Amycolatopsis echigonensis]MBB2506210.1 TetR family transcriptional regulator C-terminal domain-containing protein [Amycolatopsis echigonensis]
MPRVVDGERRRAHIADAVLRLAAKGGLHAVSLRAVAAESGLNIGSVRHYFDSQHELMRFAMRTTIDRTTARLVERREQMGSLSELPPDKAVDQLTEFLSELLPLDERRRTEVTVLVEFLMAARADPGLDDLAREAVQGTVTLARRILDAQARSGRFEPKDPEVEAPRLAALLDGIAFRAVLQPDLTSAEECVAILRAHLAELIRPAGDTHV